MVFVLAVRRGRCARRGTALATGDQSMIVDDCTRALAATAGAESQRPTALPEHVAKQEVNGRRMPRFAITLTLSRRERGT